MNLVTGATGCLGSKITQALVERGEDVAILVRPGESSEAFGAAARKVRIRIGDVRDPASVRRAMQGVQRLFHLAGVAIPLNRFRTEMEAVNIGGARIVAEAALEAGVERMVHTSSSAAVGYAPNGVVADETFPYNGADFDFAYMHTKHAGERAVLEVGARGLDVVVVNPTAVMAPGGHPRYSWAALVERVRQLRVLLCPSGGVGVLTRRDMVDGHLKAMEYGRPGERYLLNSANVTYRELLKLVIREVGSRAILLPIPAVAVRAAGWMCSAYGRFAPDPHLLPTLASENAVFLNRCVYWDQGKAVRELGLIQTELSEAIREVQQSKGRQG